MESRLDLPEEKSEKASVEAQLQINDQHWCFAWMPDTLLEEGEERGTMIRGFKWKTGEQINVSFLDGIPSVQERVKQVALKWVAPGLANLKLIFRKDTTNTDIRISFKQKGSWSTIGTSCRNIKDKTRPTMNYGWLTEQSTDEELERVVLHEFGHALGMTHEHMNPAGGIPWNRKQVTEDLSGPPNNWSPEQIENNMFRQYATHETNFTALDPKSIMMYPIPAKWTTDGFSVGLNTALSETDEAFIRKEYPKQG